MAFWIPLPPTWLRQPFKLYLKVSKFHKQIFLFSFEPKNERNYFLISALSQRYTYRVLQTIQMKLILLWVWAERAVLGRAKTASKFKYEI